jgi:hypothetical protein
VPHEVVDAVKRFACSPRDPLGRLDADQERAHETRTVSNRYGVDLVQSNPGDCQRITNDGSQISKMIARRELRNDASERSVDVHLTLNDVAQHYSVVTNYSRPRLVARGLDSEEERHVRAV